jgi:hypothetical protein
VSTAPASQKSGTPSKDGSCAGTSGFNCLGWSEGECCSQYGWCGSTDGHCKTGCNALYGNCAGAASSPATKDVVSSTRTTLLTSTRTAPATTASASAPGTCSNLLIDDWVSQSRLTFLFYNAMLRR